MNRLSVSVGHPELQVQGRGPGDGAEPAGWGPARAERPAGRQEAGGGAHAGGRRAAVEDAAAGRRGDAEVPEAVLLSRREILSWAVGGDKYTVLV